MLFHNKTRQQSTDNKIGHIAEYSVENLLSQKNKWTDATT